MPDSKIQFIINGYISGEISDNEMTSWLKEVFQKGMSHEEIINYTHSMVKSGAELDLSHLPGFIIDKHSTGGIGDKVSLILGPLLAACGCYVPMLAGRGLAHTGGTIDKLESIPNYKTMLSLTEFQKVVESVGISIMEQTEEICPADKKIYALRDVTGTVASNGLICGSIMSKKIAEGIQGLVLDIKVGNGAFMKNLSQAKKLGNLLRDVGELFGLKVIPCYTDMNQPLGNAAGIWCEVIESIECLKGNGPPDLMEVVYYLGTKALTIAGIRNPVDQLHSKINNGNALEIFIQMVEAHGGHTETLLNTNIHTPKYKQTINSESDGFISQINTLIVGNALVQLGGGRIVKEDIIDQSTGVLIFKKIGTYVEKGEPILKYFCSNKSKFLKGGNLLQNCIQVQADKPIIPSLIYKIN